MPLMGGSFLNAGGGDFGEDIGDDLDDVDRLDPEVDVGFRRRGGGESGCMWVAFSRSPRPSIFLLTLDRDRGGGVSPPSG